MTFPRNTTLPGFKAIPQPLVTYLQVQVGVTKVRFEDGTLWERWRAEPESAARIFSSSLLEADTAKCDDWRWEEKWGAAIVKWNDPETHRLRGIADVRLFQPTAASLNSSRESYTYQEQLDLRTGACYFYDCSIDLGKDSASCGEPTLDKKSLRPLSIGGQK